MNNLVFKTHFNMNNLVFKTHFIMNNLVFKIQFCFQKTHFTINNLVFKTQFCFQKTHFTINNLVFKIQFCFQKTHFIIHNLVFKIQFCRPTLVFSKAVWTGFTFPVNLGFSIVRATWGGMSARWLSSKRLEGVRTEKRAHTLISYTTPPKNTRDFLIGVRDTWCS